MFVIVSKNSVSKVLQSCMCVLVTSLAMELIHVLYKSVRHQLGDVQTLVSRVRIASLNVSSDSP